MPVRNPAKERRGAVGKSLGSRLFRGGREEEEEEEGGRDRMVQGRSAGNRAYRSYNQVRPFRFTSQPVLETFQVGPDSFFI